MQDLIGVGVADAAQYPGIGQRALEGVIFPAERRLEGGRVARQHVDAARIVLSQTIGSLHHV
jgi:hypothetical protein